MRPQTMGLLAPSPIQRHTTWVVQVRQPRPAIDAAIPNPSHALTSGGSGTGRSPRCRRRLNRRYRQRGPVLDSSPATIRGTPCHYCGNHGSHLFRRFDKVGIGKVSVTRRDAVPSVSQQLVHERQVFSCHDRLTGGRMPKAARRLVLLDSAETLGDLAALPGNRLEALRAGRVGQHSIRINAQWRVCFRWTDDGPEDVEIAGYR